MRRKTKVTMIATESAAETYERFLLTKRANGVKPKPLRHTRSIFTRFQSIWTSANTL